MEHAAGAGLDGSAAQGRAVSLLRVDPRFLLPHPSRSVVVLGALESWRIGLEQAGVEVDEAGEDGTPSLVVTEPRHLSRALALRPEGVLVEGRVDPRALRSAGLRPRAIAALPRIGAAERLVPVDEPDVVRAAVGGVRASARPWSRLARLPLRLAAPSILPRLPALITVASREGGSPFLVKEAESLGVPPDVRWFLAAGGTLQPHLKRNVFYLFRSGSAAPSWVIKFSRVDGYSEPVDWELRGLEAARTAHPVVRDKAPALLGRVLCGGVHASVETAAPGRPLASVLSSTRSRASRWAWIDTIARWLEEVAHVTTRSDALAPPDWLKHREDLEAAWRPFGAPGDLWDRVRDVPPVFQHNDLWPENVIVDGSRFGLVDWERARARGLPLGDVVFFVLEAVATMERCTGDEARADRWIRLLRGEHQASARLFGWIARIARAGHVPPEAVGALTTIAILERGYAPWSRRHDGPPATRSARARLAHAWLSHPRLGPDWQAYRDAGGAPLSFGRRAERQSKPARRR
jgi:hypothetical protein